MKRSGSDLRILQLASQDARPPSNFNSRAKPYSGAADAMSDARDMHALRYTAAAELPLSGRDDDRIVATPGQSKRMAAHAPATSDSAPRATEGQQVRNLVSPLANRTEQK